MTTRVTILPLLAHFWSWSSPRLMGSFFIFFSDSAPSRIFFMCFRTWKRKTLNLSLSSTKQVRTSSLFAPPPSPPRVVETASKREQGPCAGNRHPRVCPSLIVFRPHLQAGNIENYGGGLDALSIISVLTWLLPLARGWPNAFN